MPEYQEDKETVLGKQMKDEEKYYACLHSYQQKKRGLLASSALQFVSKLPYCSRIPI
jgi:hypothetical protein